MSKGRSGRNQSVERIDRATLKNLHHTFGFALRGGGISVQFTPMPAVDVYRRTTGTKMGERSGMPPQKPPVSV